MRHHTLSLRCLGVLLGIAGALAVSDAIAEQQPPTATEPQSTYYTYSNDWAIVSAPPPPGPYQSVNVDPRIPGQEDVTTPFVGGVEPPPVQGEQQPGDFAVGAPPAAGSSTPTPPAAYSGQKPYVQEPPPGYYRSPGNNQSWPAPVRNYQQSYGYPRSGYPRYGYAPSPWTNPPAQRTEEEVPPPPAYNQMSVPPVPDYRNGPTPDQFYRRGSGTQ
jgi:hypothetical protein